MHQSIYWAGFIFDQILPGDNRYKM